ncbi:MAG TPA: PDZ domain-containing protein, partial [Beijerinckiaceae bacterium]|nr:PDZ domain-containing protein [Beijerinckiaceae bacterium]
PKKQNERSAMKGFGVTLAPADSVPGAGNKGVVVTNIDPEGVAAQKGLRSGDVILEAGGHAVSHPADVMAALNAAKKDGRKAVLLRVKNGDTTRFVALATSKAG